MTLTRGVQDLVQGLLFLLYNPNYEDAYNWIPTDASMHEENVRASLLGVSNDGLLSSLAHS